MSKVAIKSARGAKTVTGVDSEVMKSALQKWIRRGDRKAIQAAIELWRLAEQGFKGLQTNCLNRVRVIAIEDVGVGPGNLKLASLVLETLLKEPTPSMAAELAVLVERLLSSPKNRLCSLLYNAFANQEGRRLIQLGGFTMRFIDQNAALPAASVPLPAASVPLPVPLPTTTPAALPAAIFQLDPRDWSQEIELGKSLDMLSMALQQKSPESVYWADRFIGSIGKLKMQGQGKTEQRSPINLFWDRLEKAGDLPSGTLAVYKKTYWLRRTAKDARVFWLAPLVGVLLGFTKQDFEPEALEMRGSPEFQQLFTDPKPMKFEPWIFDWHTRKGRMGGATKYDFAVENSLVVPESFPDFPPTFPTVEQLKHCYIGVKARETKEDPNQWNRVVKNPPKRQKIEAYLQ